MRSKKVAENCKNLESEKFTPNNRMETQKLFTAVFRAKWRSSCFNEIVMGGQQ